MRIILRQILFCNTLFPGFPLLQIPRDPLPVLHRPVRHGGLHPESRAGEAEGEEGRGEEGEGQGGEGHGEGRLRLK